MLGTARRLLQVDFPDQAVFLCLCLFGFEGVDDESVLSVDRILLILRCVGRDQSGTFSIVDSEPATLVRFVRPSIKFVVAHHQSLELSFLVCDVFVVRVFRVFIFVWTFL